MLFSWIRMIAVLGFSLCMIAYGCPSTITPDEKTAADSGNPTTDSHSDSHANDTVQQADSVAKDEVVALDSVKEAPADNAPDTSTTESPADKGTKTSLLEDVQQGDPKVKAADRLAFLPGGILLIGDGEGDRIIAIETSDTNPQDAAGNDFTTITSFGGKMTAAIGGGVKGSDLQLRHIAVNPISKRVYVSLRRVSTKEHILLTMNGKGEFSLFDTTNVRYVSISYPAIGTPGSLIAGLGYADGYVIASAMKSQWNPSQIIAIPTPLKHGDSAKMSRTRSYHRSHVAWETEAPIDTFFPFTHEGKVHIGASFTCAPVVRFAIEKVIAGDNQVVGQTPYDYGAGRRVSAFVYYEKNGEKFLLANIVDFQNRARAVKVQHAMLVQTANNDVKAPVIVDQAFRPVHSTASLAPSFDSVQMLVPYDAQKALVIKGNDIQTIALP